MTSLVPPVRVLLKKLDPGLATPSYAHPGDAGADLRITLDVTLQPFERRLVPTGVAIALPPGTVGLVHPRSGLAHTQGLSVVNAPGTIDEGYRGEIKVCLINLDPVTPIALNRGDRIAQLVIQSYETAEFCEVEDLDDTARGAGGHGSTGGFSA